MNKIKDDMNNSGLSNKRHDKKIDDEFYTSYDDIEKELIHYSSLFKNKNIYCNCDSKDSNFVKYFYNNFSELGLKSLTATSYGEPVGTVSYTCTGKYLSNNILLGNGDFRSNEVSKYLEYADIVISNPPFSLKEEYINLLDKFSVDFIIICPLACVFNKNIFKNYLMKNKIHVGYNMVDKFILPNSEIKSFGNVTWITSYDFCDKPFLELSKKFNKEEAIYFDNSDILKIDKTSDIPCDYDGIMGVPISFITKYNSNQFEIVGMVSDLGYDSILCKSRLNGKKTFMRIGIRNKLL